MIGNEDDWADFMLAKIRYQELDSLFKMGSGAEGPTQRTLNIYRQMTELIELWGTEVTKR